MWKLSPQRCYSFWTPTFPQRTVQSHHRRELNWSKPGPVPSMHIEKVWSQNSTVPPPGLLQKCTDLSPNCTDLRGYEIGHSTFSCQSVDDHRPALCADRTNAVSANAPSPRGAGSAISWPSKRMTWTEAPTISDSRQGREMSHGRHVTNGNMIHYLDSYHPFRRFEEFVTVTLNHYGHQNVSHSFRGGS